MTEYTKKFAVFQSIFLNQGIYADGKKSFDPVFKTSKSVTVTSHLFYYILKTAIMVD